MRTRGSTSNREWSFGYRRTFEGIVRRFVFKVLAVHKNLDALGFLGTVVGNENVIPLVLFQFFVGGNLDGIFGPFVNEMSRDLIVLQIQIKPNMAVAIFHPRDGSAALSAF